MNTESTSKNFEEHQNIVTGLFKFGPEVSPMTIGMFAREWFAKDEKQLMHLYCRGGSKQQNVLGFMYKLDVDADETQEKFAYRLTDKLRRAFGNGLVGWDLSSPTWLLK